MKRKLLMGLLALSGGLTVVGSGFSAWYFSQTVDTINSNAAIHVTDIVDGAGSLTALADGNDLGTDKLYLELDQGGYTNATVTTKGISLKKLANGAVPNDDDLEGIDQLASIGAKYSIAKDKLTLLQRAGIKKGTFKAVITLTSDATTYVKFADNYSVVGNQETDGLNTEKTTFTFSKDVDLENASIGEVGTNFEESFTFTTAVTDESCAMFEYKSKPNDKTDYEAMKSALNGKELLIVSYSFTLDDTVGG